MKELYVGFNVDDFEYREVIYWCSEWGGFVRLRAGHAMLYLPSKYVKAVRRKHKKVKDNQEM